MTDISARCRLHGTFIDRVRIMPQHNEYGLPEESIRPDRGEIDGNRGQSS
ncbi:MAG: hypothetical protein HND55_15195 [Pseudomonadota bacterium]|nr:MAG: hypothetical protein HND55_15195 [Pseudomonadota bacterium]